MWKETPSTITKEDLRNYLLDIFLEDRKESFSKEDEELYDKMQKELAEAKWTNKSMADKEQIKELDEKEIEYKLLLSEDLLNHLYEGYIYRNGNMRILMNPTIFYIKELTGDPDNNLYTIVGKRELEKNEEIKEFALNSIVETYMKLGLTKEEFIETYDALTEYNEARRK